MGAAGALAGSFTFSLMQSSICLGARNGLIPKHITKDGRTVYFWRAKVPIKEVDGSVVWRNVERSTKAGTLAGAHEAARKLEADYHERAGSSVQEVSEHTLADAALLYIKAGHSRRYLAPIIELIGSKLLIEISQEVAQDVVDRLYPGCAASTVNRQVFTPLLAVLNYAARVRMCPPPALQRPKGHDKPPKLDLPDDQWSAKVLPLLSPAKRACVLLIRLHGLRISEAIEREVEDLDARLWRLSIPDTKTGEPVCLPLSKPVIEAIKEMRAHQAKINAGRVKKCKRPVVSKWLFGTGDRNKVGRAIRAACEKAEVRAYGTHAIGRHSFATGLLEGGKSVKFLMSAGRWKSPKMPMVRYGHLEKSEVNEEVNEIAAGWRPAQKPAKIVKFKKA